MKRMTVLEYVDMLIRKEHETNLYSDFIQICEEGEAEDDEQNNNGDVS